VTSVAIAEIEVWDEAEQPRRIRKKAVQQGRSERRGESYSGPYVEPLSEARTPLADFFRILLALYRKERPRQGQDDKHEAVPTERSLQILHVEHHMAKIMDFHLTHLL
jgi:hypothetical protein